MDKNRYQDLVNRHTEKENVFTNTLVAFFVGGIMGTLAQIVLNLYQYYFSLSSKDASVYMITTFIFLGCILTCFGFFDKWVHKAKCGLIIPITGFAHSMQSAALEYRKEGLVTGIGANIFKLAGTVIVYGIVSAYVFGMIRLIIFGG